MTRPAVRPADTASEIPGPAWVARLAAECAHLAHRLDRLQDVLAGLAGGAGADDATVEGVQTLDLATQEAHALAALLAATARHASGEWRIDPEEATRGLPLADIVNRLNDRPTRPAASGDADLF